MSALDGKGQPTPLIQCIMRPPESRMGVLTDSELAQVVAGSTLYSTYNRRVERPSAKDILAAQKPTNSASESSAPEVEKESNEPSIVTSLSKNTLVRQLVRQFFREMTRAIMVALGMKKK